MPSGCVLLCSLGASWSQAWVLWLFCSVCTDMSLPDDRSSMGEPLTRQDLRSTRPDLQPEIGKLSTAIDEFEAKLGAKIDAQTRILTIRLGSILIAGLIAAGLLMFGSVPVLIP